MTKQIAWNDYGGSIEVAYTGTKGDTVVVTSTRNTLIDREQTLTLATTDGKATAQVTVRQSGQRELYRCKGGEVYAASDGGYAVLKTR